MSREMVVKTRFKVRDNFIGRAFKRMEKGVLKFGSTSSKVFRKASRDASRFGDITRGVLAAGAIQRGLGFLTQGLRAATGGFIAFEKSAIGATARFKDIGPNAADFEQQLKRVRRAAREAGATTEFTAAQASDSLDFLARTGLKSAEAFGVLRSQINLATASGEDFAQTADMSSDLLGAFGLAVDDSNQKIKNTIRLNDVLVKAVNSSNVTIETLFDTLKGVAPVANITNTSMEETVALAAALGTTGIKGSLAMTAMKNVFLRLQAPTKEVQEALDFLNVTMDDGTGNARKMTDVLEEVGKKIKGMGNLQQAKILNALFGKRAIAGGKNLVDAIAGIREFEQGFKDAAGTGEDTAARLRQSIGIKLLTLLSAATDKVFDLFVAFETRGKGAITSLTEAVRGFDMTPIIVAVGTTAEILKTLFNVVKPFIPIMPVFVAGWVAYNAILKTMAIAKVAVMLLQLFRAVRLTSIAMVVFNQLWMLSPLGFVITAITLIVAGLVLIERKFKVLGKIKRFFGGAGAESPTTAGAQAEGAPGADVEAPNKREIEARQDIGFKGELDITGAPEGSTVKTKTTGAPAIEVNMLGAN